MTGVLLLAAATAASTSPKPGVLKTFSDWTVGCDNARDCQAVSLMEMETTDNQLTILIKRGGGRTAGATLSVANIESRKPGEAVSIAIEGGPAIRSVPMPQEGTPVEFAFDRPLFEAIRNARYIELRGDDERQLGHASLSGLSAAILYIDDRQLRAKTVTALSGSGAAPATTIPLPPPLPQISYRASKAFAPAKLTAAEVIKLRNISGCDAELEDASTPTEIVAIAKGKALAFLSCGNGAYNFSAVPFIVSGAGKTRKFQPANFDLAPGLTEGAGMPFLVNAGWDAATATLSSYNKGRGLGDCGTAEHYVWDGKRFRLIQQRVMGDCRGVIDWIPVWRANTIRKK
jgi:Protein of unknown function (DUF1176)